METEDDTTIDDTATKPEPESVKSISKKKADELEKKETPPVYQGTKSEQKIAKFVSKRAKEMKEYRKSLGIEKRWKEADVEYVPQELPMTVQGKRFETDQQTGIRSRLVPIGDESQNWRSDNSDPMLLNKIQIALSVIIDQNPEAMLVALNKRFEERNALMYALWKRNWEITNAKEILKLFAFNLMKYGWAVGRSYPKVVKYNKKVLVSKDPTDPSKDKYDKKEIEWFNDVAKENMDPWKTWIDENTKPYDYYSMNECYYEVDYTYDQAKIEFEQYPNFKTIGKSAKVPAAVDANNPNRTANDSEMRQDIITFGFYENRLKDLYVIYVPQKKIVLHTSPLPNDDGMLSLWQSMWILRDSKLPYGVSLWEIIRQDKQLYDKMGALPITFAGLSGMGDLIVTCMSHHSRNRFVGEEIGKGRNVTEVLSDMTMVAEGVATAKSVHQLAQKHRVEMPMAEEVYKVLFENKNPRQATLDLMLRDTRGEGAH